MGIKIDNLIFIHTTLMFGLASSGQSFNVVTNVIRLITIAFIGCAAVDGSTGFYLIVNYLDDF